VHKLRAVTVTGRDGSLGGRRGLQGTCTGVRKMYMRGVGQNAEVGVYHEALTKTLLTRS
jgi:hypothetical protein